MKLFRSFAVPVMLLGSASGALANDISNSTWNEQAAANTASPPAGWPAGVVTPTQVSPMMRETMGAIKRWYNRSQPTKTSSGTANAQTLTYDATPGAFATGETYRFIVGSTNTGATTLNINGIGATAVQLNGAALTGGELLAGTVAEVRYDGTVFQLVVNLAGQVAPARVYVSTTGNDANSCRTTALACATMARALTAGTALVNTKGRSLYIKLAAGSYTQSLFVNGALTGMINSDENPNGTYVQAGQLVIEGEGSTITTWNGSAAVCATLASSNYANIAIRALKINGNSTACQSTLFGQMYGTIHILDDIEFGPASSVQIHLENASQAQVWSSYKISGGALRHITSSQSSVYLNSAFPTGVTTFVGTPTFEYQFAWATQSGVIQWNIDATMVGSFIGRSYAITANGYIKVPSTSLSWLPGTIAGYSASGGVYEGAQSPITIGAVRSNGDGTYQHATCDDILDQVCVATAWTPSLVFNGGSSGMTYSSRVGRYFRSNDLITVMFDITLSAKGASTGSAGIAGLPFLSHASMVQPCEIGHYAALSGITNFQGTSVSSAESAISLMAGGSTGVTALDDTNFTNTSRISGRCIYAKD